MRKRVFTYAFFVMLAVLSLPLNTGAEWYVRPSVGGNFASGVLEVESLTPYGSVVEVGTVEVTSQDVINFKAGYWFTANSFSKMFTRTNLGIEFELEQYSVSARKSFTQLDYESGYSCVYVCDIFGCPGWVCFYDPELRDSIDFDYEINGKVRRVGCNFLLRRQYNKSEIFPLGRNHVYGGFGFAYEQSDITVTVNGVKDIVADDGKVVTIGILGTDVMLTPKVGVFAELNFSQSTHEFPVPFDGKYPGIEVPTDIGSVYLTGLTYHF